MEKFRERKETTVRQSVHGRREKTIAQITELSKSASQI
jgi:hypothetical protein